MRLLTLLVLAVCALSARAATIPRDTPVVVSAVEAVVKTITEQPDQLAPNNPSEDELIKPSDTIKDIGNELRTQKVDQIPVKVVAEAKPILKLESPETEIANEIPKDDKLEDNKKKPEQSISDVSDFGDDDVEDAGSLSSEPGLGLSFLTDALQSAHQSVQITIDSFSQTAKSWINHQSALLPSQEQISQVKSIIDNNISKLNNTIQGYFNPEQAAKLVEQPEESAKHIEVVESDLKNLENNFENEVKGVLVGSTLRADNSSNSSTNSSGNAPLWQNIQSVIQQGFSNISSSMQNLFNQNSNGDNSTNNLWLQFSQNIGSLFNQQPNPSSGAQSDESGTSRPSIFQSIQNIFPFRPPPFQIPPNTQIIQQNGQQPQSDQPQQPNRPIIQAIQNNPIVQGISGVFNRPPVSSIPTTNPQPAASSPADPTRNQEEGSNVVPPKPDNSEPAAPQEPSAAQDQNVQPEQQPSAGPIQQAIKNNPIVQGIAGAVQKIQTAVIKPDEPRKISHLLLHGHGGQHHHHEEGSNTDKGMLTLSSMLCKTPLLEIYQPALLN